MTDIEIARNTKSEPITNIAKKLGIKPNEIVCYGTNKAKIISEPKKQKGKLVLVTAMNPTSAGEGKTTVSIGLADALRKIKKQSCLALREPSLGPVFGRKGGATGGGYSQVIPMEDINLHFTGDFHAITSANNLLCACIDNSIFQGNELNIDPEKILFNRCFDMNDRALRTVQVGLSMDKEVPRNDNFSITSASEIMAILSLAENMDNLKTMLGNITVALNKNGDPVYAKDLNAVEAMAILLKDAIRPNLVQTLEGTPAIIHCGPFANIAHGCNSIIATKTALGLSDYCITEAGFGSDLGAEKFLDFKCRRMGIAPDAIVLVCTVRAIKLHGGQSLDKLHIEDFDALNLGLPNLKKHIENITNVFKLPCVVAINKFYSDTDREINAIKTYCKDLNITAVVADSWANGGKGSIELAQEVVKLCNTKSKLSYAYSLDLQLKQKIEILCSKIYGASGVEFSEKAKESMATIQRLKLENLPIIVAKTQYSLSDNSKLLGEPKDFVMQVRDITIKSGAGFLVVIMGDIMLMPGLSKQPALTKMHIDNNNIIEGLF
ncbi:MAG: formate--tetrahydrofolate ligase [Clostridia bacterium]|nr:formate--tetrahydrofolate ligase [Clostridia bacterium]